jgi:hypothetical protein
MNLPQKVSDWPAEWRELWAERAAIMEYEGRLSRFTAEIRAEQDVRKLARLAGDFGKTGELLNES